MINQITFTFKEPIEDDSDSDNDSDERPFGFSSSDEESDDDGFRHLVFTIVGNRFV